MTNAKKTESGTVKKSQSKELIFQKIANIMKKVEAITKDRENISQKYQFRGIDDVYNSLHDMLAGEEVFTVPEVLEERHEERKSKSGSILIYSIIKIQYKFMTIDGSFIPVTLIGEGMDTGDKASNKAMAAAHKYALLQLFLIPTGEAKDSEEDSHQVAEKEKSEKDFDWGKNGVRAGGESLPTANFKMKDKIVSMTFYQALPIFQEAKKHIATKHYYTVLGEFGYEKSNQIPIGKMPEVYEKLVQLYKDLKEDERTKAAAKEEAESKEVKEGKVESDFSDEEKETKKNKETT
jgi:hypothetical protein